MQIKCVFFCRRSAAVVSLQTFPVAFEHLSSRRPQMDPGTPDGWRSAFSLIHSFISAGWALQAGVAQRIGRVAPAAFCSSWANREVSSLWLCLPLSHSLFHVDTFGSEERSLFRFRVCLIEAETGIGSAILCNTACVAWTIHLQTGEICLKPKSKTMMRNCTL